LANRLTRWVTAVDGRKRSMYGLQPQNSTLKITNNTVFLKSKGKYQNFIFQKIKLKLYQKLF